MARDPLKPVREAGAALVGEVRERLGDAREKGKSAAKHVAEVVQREVTEPLAARAMATKADIARLEARIDALERSMRKAGAKKTGGPKKATQQAAAKKAGPKKAAQSRSSR